MDAGARGCLSFRSVMSRLADARPPPLRLSREHSPLRPDVRDRLPGLCLAPRARSRRRERRKERRRRASFQKNPFVSNGSTRRISFTNLQSGDLGWWCRRRNHRRSFILNVKVVLRVDRFDRRVCTGVPSHVLWVVRRRRRRRPFNADLHQGDELRRPVSMGEGSGGLARGVDERRVPRRQGPIAAPGPHVAWMAPSGAARPAQAGGV